MIFPLADVVRVRSGRDVTVFNVHGYRYRLICAIHYNRQKVYTLRVYTHEEYDRIRWKDTL